MEERDGDAGDAELQRRVAMGEREAFETHGRLTCTSRGLSLDRQGPKRASAERTMAVEAVIWDFGGVFTSSPFEAFNRLEAELGAPRDHIRRVNAANHHENAWALFERNEIDVARFDQLFLEESTALGFPIRTMVREPSPWLNSSTVVALSINLGNLIAKSSGLKRCAG